MPPASGLKKRILQQRNIKEVDRICTEAMVTKATSEDIPIEEVELGRQKGIKLQEDN